MERVFRVTSRQDAENKLITYAQGHVLLARVQYYRPTSLLCFLHRSWHFRTASWELSHASVTRTAGYCAGHRQRGAYQRGAVQCGAKQIRGESMRSGTCALCLEDK